MIKIPEIKVNSKLLMYRKYITLISPMFPYKVGSRSLDVLASILCYTNSIKGKYSTVEEFHAALSTEEARDIIRDSIVDLYTDPRQRMKYRIDSTYFNVIISRLRGTGFFHKVDNEKWLYKSLLLKQAKVFNVAFKDIDEIDISFKISINEAEE